MFRYGVATGRCERNPAPDLHGALKPIIAKHMAAVLEPAGVSALCDLFASPTLAGKVAFRGGTAIHKLLFKHPLRYSEDSTFTSACAPRAATASA